MGSEIKDHEREVLEILALPHIGVEAFARFIVGATVVEYYTTGCGYFLTLRQPGMNLGVKTVSEPFVMGSADGIDTGWLIYLGDDQITIECHALGDDVPESYRDRRVRLVIVN